MTEWLDEQVAGIRARLTPADEGALLVLFCSDPEGEVLVAVSIDDFTDNYSAELLDGLAAILNRLGVESVLLATARRSGRPSEVDVRLWREIAPLLDPPIELIDLVVVGDDTYWSARTSTRRLIDSDQLLRAQ